MKMRKDAFWGAASFAMKARDIVMSHFGEGVVNFGDIHIKPAAFNIVPEEALLGMEFRHGDGMSLDNMEAALLELADVTANEFGLQLNISKLHDIAPAPMSPKLVQTVEAAADKLSLSHTQLLSFAGHDAQSMAKITEAVMIFLPSVDGVSHTPKEFSRDADCINAANLLLESVLALG
jgi:N-carbamoyl-L-amino-acid hydrolase